MSDVDKSKKIGKWYFGGLASAGAACCTHPLDLLKVHLQTSGNVYLVISDLKKIMVIITSNPSNFNVGDCS